MIRETHPLKETFRKGTALNPSSAADAPKLVGLSLHFLPHITLPNSNLTPF